MCLKTPAAVKGGWLVMRKSHGRIIQRETVQTHPDDFGASLDPTRHRFHTSNIWFDLQAPAAVPERTGGVLKLPLIRNDKTETRQTLRCRQSSESATGAAVAVFEGATAIEGACAVPAGQDDQRSAGAALGSLRTDRRPPSRGSGRGALLKLARTYHDREVRRPFPNGAPCPPRRTSLTVGGDSPFVADVTVAGEGKLPDHGDPRISPGGATGGPDWVQD